MPVVAAGIVFSTGVTRGAVVSAWSCNCVCVCVSACVRVSMCVCVCVSVC